MGQGNIIGKANLPATTGSKGLWNLREQYAANRDSTWPGYDPQWSNTNLLLKTALPVGDAFIDSSPNAFTVTRNGDTIQTTSTPYAPYWSNYFDGSGDYLTTPSSSSLDFLAGDCTIECWFFLTAWTASHLFQIGNAGNARLNLFLSGNKFNLYTGGAIYISTSTLNLNQWYHIALTKQSGTWTLWLNGVSQGTSTTLNYPSGANNSVGIGWQHITGQSGDYHAGYISNLRMVAGSALYTSAFTPPTAPLTAVTGTRLLTCQDNRFIDRSTNNFTLTRAGDVAVSRFSPFAWTWSAASGGSGYFDGVGDYLTLSNTSGALVMGTGSFTIEAWVFRQSATVTYESIISSEAVDNSSTGLGFGLNSSNFPYLYSYSFLLTSSIAITPGAWNHVALVRNGTTATIYVNGVSGGSTTVTNNFTDTRCAIGTNSWANNGNYFTGFISSLRAIKGVALYTTNFTPPASPVTAVSGTSLLLNFTNPAIYDTSGSAAFVRRVGNVSRGTAAPATDLTSVGLGGSGDYLTAAAPSGQLGVGDFTVEAWVFPTARTGTYPTIWCNYSTWTTGSFGLFAGHNSYQTKYTVGVDGAFPALISTSDIAYGQWAHLAVVRSNGVIRLYVNGVSEGGTYTSSAAQNQGNGSSFIGVPGDAVSGNTFTGLISNLRVERSARYTTNFTPSRSPHTVAANTVLALNQTLDTWDLTAKNDLTSTGTVVATPAMFTGSALSLNGSQVARAYSAGTLATNFGFGTGDFCIEAWVYPTAVTGADRCLWDTRASAGDAGMVVFINSSGQLSNYTSNAIRLTSTPALVANTWQHVAVVRVAGTLAYFINGQPAGAVAYTTTIDCPGQVNIGIRFDNAAGFSGQMDELRVTKGNGRYVGAFSPTTAPFDRDWEPPYNDTFVTSNVLQVKSIDLPGATNNVFRDDSTNAFAVTRNGDVTQGSFSPYIPSGYWSNFFDGNGDYLTLPSSAAFSFNADFTVEFWMRLSSVSTSTYPALIDFRGNGTNGAYIYIGLDNGNLILFTNSAVRIRSGSLNAATWYHVALVRSGTTTTLYLNGASVGAISDSTSYINNGISICANSQVISQCVDGYLSNLRLVKGTAVYTANFTPPNAPLTAISGTSLLTCQDNRFKDNSTNNFTLTRNGDVSVSRFDPFPLAVPVTTVATTNPGSVYFDGTDDRIEVAANNAFLLGSGNFTHEFWIKTTRTSTSWVTGYGVSNPTAGNQMSYLVVLSGGTFYFDMVSGGGTETLVSYGTTAQISDGNWHHLAVTREGNTVRTFRDGILSQTITYTATIQDPGSGTPIYRVGGISGTYERPYDGSISNLRLVKGAALYTASFTPPTAPLTAIANTSLLICHDPGGFTDASTNNFTVTKYGDAVAREDNPFQAGKRATYVYGGSGYFDGTGDYLSIPTNTAFDFGTGDFTVEAWVNPATLPSDWFIVSASGSGGLFLGYGAGAVGYGRAGVAWDSGYGGSGVGLAVNAWSHVALSRSGTSIRLFVNGVQAGATATNSQAYNISTGSLNIGSQGANYYCNGHIANVRIVKGTAVYTANFTPPTSPVTAVSGTSLLLNFDNAGVYDATGQRSNIVHYGDVKTSTTVTQLGQSVMYFDGTGDYMNVNGPASPALAFGTGDFTIEGWLRLGVAGGGLNILDFRPTNTNGAYPDLYYNGTKLAYYLNGGDALVGATTIVTNTWYHFALCRSGTTTRLFVNGALDASFSDSTNYLCGVNRPMIGGHGYLNNSSNSWNGYLYDIRITRTARYVAPFTPPSEPFPVA